MSEEDTSGKHRMEGNKSSINRRHLLRNMSTIAGIGMIGVPAVVAGSGEASAAADTFQQGRAIEAALAEMSDYIRLTDEYTLRVDWERAERHHVSEHSQRIALDYRELNNRTVSNLKNVGRQTSSDRSERLRTLSDQFEPYFMLIANGNVTEALSTSDSNIHGGGDGDVTILGGGCGYGKQNPHPCPNRYWSGVYRNRKGGIKRYLRNHGYHETAEYAAYNRDTDWTNCRSAYGCGGCKFRKQANIRRRNGSWTFSTQAPEPNPEVLDYVWPTFDWGPYVRWWHRSFC